LLLLLRIPVVLLLDDDEDWDNRPSSDTVFVAVVEVELGLEFEVIQDYENNKL
jgi:hypothetical protein